MREKIRNNENYKMFKSKKWNNLITQLYLFVFHYGKYLGFKIHSSNNLMTQRLWNLLKITVSINITAKTETSNSKALLHWTIILRVMSGG